MPSNGLYIVRCFNRSFKMQESLLMSPSLEKPTESLEFLGEVPTSELINGTDLASRIGLTAGIVQNTNEPWLKFITGEGKTLYVAKKTYRYRVTWDQIHARGAVFGTATVTIQGKTYKVRLLKGAASDPTVSLSGRDVEQSWGSEWNRLFYPLVPNPVGTPTHPVSREGITYGEWANYTEAELNIGDMGNGVITWCQESGGGWRVFRSGAGLSYFGLYTPSLVNSSLGWRPVLELVS